MKNRPWSVAHTCIPDVKEYPPPPKKRDLLTSDQWSNYDVIIPDLIFIFRSRLGCEFLVKKVMRYEIF